MSENTTWNQENIKGYMLELNIKRDHCNKGVFEEYTARIHQPLGNFTLLSLFVCILAFICSLNFTNVYSTIFCIAIIIYLLVKTLFRVCKESVLYVPTVGFQQTTYYWCGLNSPFFIPKKKIDDLIINEDISWYHSFYMAIVLRNSEDSKENPLFPLFEHTKPRLAFLQKVYNRYLQLNKEKS